MTLAALVLLIVAVFVVSIVVAVVSMHRAHRLEVERRAARHISASEKRGELARAYVDGEITEEQFESGLARLTAERGG